MSDDKSALISHIGPAGVMECYREYCNAVFVGDSPTWRRVHRLGDPDDRDASAQVNLEKGIYQCFSPAETVPFFEILARFTPGKKWQEVMSDIARKYSFTLTATSKQRAKNKLDFQPWNPMWRMTTVKFCKVGKHGLTLNAIERAGGRPAKWCRHSVITLPCYGAIHGAIQVTDKPQAHQFYDIVGQGFPRSEKRKLPDGRTTEVTVYDKIRSEGPTACSLMNKHAVSLLQKRSKDIEFVIRAAGPSDMLAIMAAIPPDKVDKWLVTANANGEGGAVCQCQIDLLSPYPCIIINDGDFAGCNGDIRWFWALRKACPLVAVGRLPYEIKHSHGYDSRDFLNGTTWGKEYLPVATIEGLSRDGEPPDKPPNDRNPSNQHRTEQEAAIGAPP